MKLMISYSRKDEAFALPLYDRLVAAGIDVWIDQYHIPAGISWRQSIFDAVIASDMVIMCLSDNFLTSDMCRMEAFLARCYKKKILPILIEDVASKLSDVSETKGIDDRFILDYCKFNIFGLKQTEDELFQILLNTIQRPAQVTDNYQAYIAYRTYEAKFATRLADDLNAADISTWIASRSFLVGDEWQRQWNALMQAQVLIVILSEKVPLSHNIHNEVLVARTRKIPMLPVLAESIADIPNITDTLAAALDTSYEMRLLTEINWFMPKPDYASMLDELKSAIRQYV